MNKHVFTSMTYHYSKFYIFLSKKYDLILNNPLWEGKNINQFLQYKNIRSLCTLRKGQTIDGCRNMSPYNTADTDLKKLSKVYDKCY